MSNVVDVAQSLTGSEDTIVALATPSGRGALAIVRLSGPAALEIAAAVAEPSGAAPLAATPRTARLCRLISPDNAEVLDHALVTVFTRPDSFTGENVVEISAHGGHYGPARIMAALVAQGARPAHAGEFTRRAVLNGKIDVTQAEAIGDLIDAGSTAMHRSALNQLDGNLSRMISTLRNGILGLEALIAYDIDFPEEDQGLLPRVRVQEATEGLITSIDRMLRTVPVGQVVRQGAIVVIAGEPNVGKSSLFNSLAGEPRAIVTPVPGTTRDAIEAFVETDNWPLRLVDTAGLRETTELIEQIGIEVSERYLNGAHVVLGCAESELALDRTLTLIKSLSTAPIVAILTKSDLAPKETRDLSRDDSNTAAIRVSTRTGEGLEYVLPEIDRTLSATLGELPVEYPVLTNARHVRGLSEARAELLRFQSAWDTALLPASLAAVHLRSAALALEEMIGAVSAEDILERVFSSFCIGK